jgi:hypothetical protein
MAQTFSSDIKKLAVKLNHTIVIMGGGMIILKGDTAVTFFAE